MSNKPGRLARSGRRESWTVLASAALLLVIVITAIYLGTQTRRQFLTISAGWTEYSREADHKGALISALRGYLGYGGIIHTFKNYVLRQDEEYRARLIDQLRRFDAVVDEYLSLPLAEAERGAVETVKDTIDAYRAKLAIAERAAVEGWPVERTDDLVRVDDTNAIEALEDLEIIWQSNRKRQTQDLFASVESGNRLIGIGFASLLLLVVAAISLGFVFLAVLRQMQAAYGHLSEELARRESLERSEQRLAQAVEQSPASVMITDTTGNIEYVNRHFEDLSGWSRDEVIGKTPKFLQSGDTDKAEYQQMREVLADGRPWRGTFHNIRKDGGSYWIEATILPLRADDGTSHSLLGIGEDITERLQAREHMVRAQKIEAVGLLAGGIAHDFNSVLTSILGVNGGANSGHVAAQKPASSGVIGAPANALPM